MKLAVIFDLDGVIVDNNRAHEIAFRKFLGKHGKTLRENEYREKIAGMHNEEIFPYLFPGQPEKHEIFAKQKEEVYREIYAEDIRPVNGLLDFLDELEQEGVPIALATNAPQENITFVLTHTRTMPYFKEIVDSSMVRRGKPDPEMFLLAGRKLGLAPERCVVIEDSLPGIEAARAAGMKVVGVATTHLPGDLDAADLVVKDFTELDLERLRTLF